MASSVVPIVGDVAAATRTGASLTKSVAVSLVVLKAVAPPVEPDCEISARPPGVPVDASQA